MVQQYFFFVAALFSSWPGIRVSAQVNKQTRPMREGKHSFPEAENGKQLANEFQLLHPGNVKNKEGLTSSTYTITEVSPLLIDNDDVVTVSFATDNPGSSDWIAAYAPADADINTVVPVKFGWCDDLANPNYLTSGAGSLQFNMTNLRTDIKFYYFTNGLSYPNMVASSDSIVQYSNINAPGKARVVPTGDYDTLALLWSSAYSTAPTLKWGTVEGEYTNVITATTSSIGIEELCGAPANASGWFNTGLIHTAYFEGMEALQNKKIYYIFGDEATSDFSVLHQLYVPPLAGSVQEHRGTRVVLFCDLGRGTNDDTYTWYAYGRPSLVTIESISAQINAGEIDAVFHGGDISYATGYLSVWDFFLDMLEPVASAVPYLTTVGNHESDWYYEGGTIFDTDDSGGECGVLATRMLPMPTPATTNQPWWSYDVGLIHFIGISTEHNFTVNSDQYHWLEKDLKSVNRTATPWVILNGHRAMYINSDYGGTPTSDITVMNELIANLEPLLWRYRVNIGFYGHNHAVQRHSAVLNKTVIQASTPRTDSQGNTVHYHNDPQATVHMVIGTGGATFTINAIDPGPVWNEMVFYEYGYTIITAENASYLEWKWVYATGGEVLDRMVITQSDPTQPWELSSSSGGNKDGEKYIMSAGVTAAVVVGCVVLVLGGAALSYLLFTGVSVCTALSNWIGGANTSTLPEEMSEGSSITKTTGEARRQQSAVELKEIEALAANPMVADEHAM